MKSLSFIKFLLKKYPLLITGYALLLVGENIIGISTIISIIPVADLLIKKSTTETSLVTMKLTGILNYVGVSPTIRNFLLIFLGLHAFRSVVQICVKYLMLRTKYRFLRGITLDTYEDFFNARWNFFSSNSQGMIINTFSNELSIVGDAFGSLAQAFAVLLSLCVLLVVPFYLSWQATLICVAIASLGALPFLLLGKINYRLGKQNTDTANQAMSVIHENILSAKIILGYFKQGKGLKMLAEAFDSHILATVKVQMLGFIVPQIYYPLGLVVLIISVFITNKMAIPLSETAAILYSLMRIVPLIGQLPALKNSIDSFFPSYEQLSNLRHEAQRLKQPSGTRKFTSFKKSILLDEVSYTYPGQENAPVFEKISITVPNGKMIALVGKSGEGKSTLIDIVMGFITPDEGSVLVDGIPLSEYDIQSYRRTIGYVPQDSLLFNMTIRENLLWVNETASFEEIKQACNLANAAEFIESFPAGYDTVVGDRGVRLSGGQIQRLALARALLARPEILILDEATSSLDSYSERLIQESIEKVAAETTVIVIAHRLSTVLKADYIYVLGKKRILEEGTYEALLGKRGEFEKMHQLQTL